MKTILSNYLPYLTAIESRREEMIAVLEKWVAINSFSDNVSGLETMLQQLDNAFGPLSGQRSVLSLPDRKKINDRGELVSIPQGKALHIVKRPEAPYRVLLAGHMDTVYPPTSPFQKAEKIDNKTMRGPGITDMKGGLLVMLYALQALEQTPWASNIGWEVLINPDEEVGSQGSQHLFIEAAERCRYGLLFEPAFPDGNFVSRRKGSANIAVVVRGRASHVGRDFYTGRNAIAALSRFIVEAEKLCSKEKRVTINIGRIEGGGPVNIVPELAIGHFNIRVETPEELAAVKGTLDALAEKESLQEGISFTLHTIAERIPKPFDEKTRTLFKGVQSCAREIGLDPEWMPSGGVCDGNILSAAGLPTIDTLGVVGGNIHTHEEYIAIDSLAERACLTSLFLMRFAAGDFT